MAKQRDDRPDRDDDFKKPAQKKPEDFDEPDMLDAAEALEPADELEIVEEAPPKPGQPKKARPTQIAGKAAQPVTPKPGQPPAQVPDLSLDEPDEVLDFAEIAEEPSTPRVPRSAGKTASDASTMHDEIEVSNLVREEGEDSGVDFQAEDVQAGYQDVSEKDLVAQAKDGSDVRLGEMAGKADRPSGVDEIAEPAKGDSEVPLGEMAGKADRPSGVDEIAEALESGRDLGRKAPESPPPKVPPSEEEAAEMLEAEAEESSAVGVGQTPRVGKKPPEEGASDSDIFSDSSGEREALAEAPKSPVPQSPFPKKPTKRDKTPKTAVASDLDELAEVEDEAPPLKKDAVSAEEEVDELEPAEDKPRDKKALKPVKPKRLVDAAVGFLIGLLVVGGVAFVVWQMQPERKVVSETELSGLRSQVNELRVAAEKVPELEEKLSESQKAAELLTAEKGTLRTQLGESQQAEKALAQKLGKSQQTAKMLAAEKAKLEAARKQAEGALVEINKQLEAANIKESGREGLEKLIATFKEVDDKLKNVDKSLAEAKIKEPGAKGVQELVATRDKLDKERQALDQAIRTAFKELVEAGLVPAGSDPVKQLVQVAKTARVKVESPLVVPLGRAAMALSNLGTGAVELLQRGFDNTAMAAELAFYRLREPLLEPPAQKLDTWLRILSDRGHRDAKDVAGAIREAEWVRSKESRADAEARAKALFVTGLALRNQDKYAEAKSALAQAVKESAGLKGATSWSKLAKQALAELSDAKRYYLPRVERLQESGDLKTALAELNAALKAIPNDGRLLAQRAVVRLEMARGKEKIAASDVNQVHADGVAAQKDAKAVAEATYVLGLLEEALGNLAQAEQFYRQALRSPATPEEQNRYRVALARLLLRDRPAAAPAPEPSASPKGKAVGRLPEEEEEVDLSDPRAALILMILTGVQPGTAVEDVDPSMEARIKESIKLAEELIKSPNPKDRAQGHMILGTALSKQGQRTEGLREFIKGIEILVPGSPSRELTVLLRDHPAFMQPSQLARPNPLLAEQHYGQGLHLYWARKYDEAEKQFESALSFFKDDARYWYFLGLSRLAQPGKRKRDAAYYAFEEGAHREAAGHPGPPEINSSLERVQGSLRQLINGFREKAVASAR